MVKTKLPRLVGDASLGKLVTYLRLAGIDTLLDPAIPDPERLSRLAHGERTILTRCQRVKRTLRSGGLIFIYHDQPVEQVRQVLADLELRRCDLMPLTRCSRCNRLLEYASGEQIIGSVPEYIAIIHKAFKRCATCEKVFWAGSHTERWLTHIDRWFNAED